MAAGLKTGRNWCQTTCFASSVRKSHAPERLFVRKRSAGRSGDEDGGAFEELNLLVLGQQQLARFFPVRSVLLRGAMRRRRKPIAQSASGEIGKKEGSACRAKPNARERSTAFARGLTQRCLMRHVE